jgi:hypothetical protein
MVDILAVLQSKPHSQHYINRYYTLIESFKTQKIDDFVYTENHHICPRAKDLFPEYANLKMFAWNKLIVTARQHYLLHWILWKAYGGSQIKGFVKMNNVGSSNQQRDYTRINSKIYEKLKLDNSVRTSKQMTENNPSKKESVKIKRREALLGKILALDAKTGEYLGRVDKNDPNVLNGTWIQKPSPCKGKKQTKEHIEKLRVTRVGKPTSDKQKKAVAEANKRRTKEQIDYSINIAINASKKPVYCQGMIFESISAASLWYKNNNIKINIGKALANPNKPDFYRLTKEEFNLLKSTACSSLEEFL